MTGTSPSVADQASAKPFFGRWSLAVVLVLAVGFILGLRQLSDNNIDFHLHGGSWIVQHQAVPVVDTYTYAAGGRPYVDLHWLFQIAVYGIYRLGGFAALSIVNAALATLLLALLALRLRRLGAGPAVSCWVLLASAVCMHYRFLMRPEVVSFLFLALVGLVLDRHLAALVPGGASGQSDSGQGRGEALGPERLWIIPLIHLLWVNTQGLVILGWAVTGISWVSASLISRRWDRPLAATLAASILATFVNPYFVDGVLFPFQLLTRFDRANIFARHVGEFTPLLSVQPLFEDKVLFGFAALLLAALAATWKRRALHEFLLPSLFFALALAAVRNVPLFVVVAAPILGKALTDAAEDIASLRLAGNSPGRTLGAVAARLRGGPMGAALCSVVAAGLVLRVLTGAYYELPGGGALVRFGVGLDRAARPVAAGEFLLEHGLDGRILNSSIVGGWLGWVLPQPVYLDMRLEVVGEDLYREEVESWAAGGLTQLLSKYGPQLIVFEHAGGAHGWVPQLRAMPEWRLVFVDEAAAVYAREGYAPLARAVDLDRLPRVKGIELTDEKTAEDILRRPAPGRMRRWLRGFLRRTGRESPWRRLGGFCASQGADRPAEQFYLAGLAADSAGNRAAFADLGALYAATERLEMALLAYDRYLEFEPEMGWARNERGIVRVGLGDLWGAISDFTRAIAADPHFAAAFRNRGLARQTTGDLRAARKDYVRALELEPADERVRQEIAAIDAALADGPVPGRDRPPLP